MRAPRRPEELGIFGGEAAFQEPIPVGQLYFPDWERYERDMRSLFASGWYTNHGPLAQRFESELADFFGVRHAIAVTNATIGLALVAKAIGISGSVVIPSWTFIATAQSMTWAGLDVVIADVDSDTQMLGIPQIEEAIASAGEQQAVGGILAVNLWGGAANPKEIEKFGEDTGIPVFFDSAHAAGCVSADGKLGGFGRAEVFSLHATKILSSAEGGVITTNDDDLAAKCRNIRSSYGAGVPVPVPLTANGRYSEAQAAIGLANLEHFEENVMRNRMTRDAYYAGLKDVPGIRLLAQPGVVVSNDSYALCEIEESEFGLSADQLSDVLKAESVVSRRYFRPGVHRCVPYADSSSVADSSSGYPVTERLSDVSIQLPVGALAGPEEAEIISGLVAASQRFAGRIRERLS